MREIVILYVIDCLRADHLGCYGYSKSTSPNIDRLALESTVFEAIYAQGTETKSSSATLFTSTYPSIHGVTTRTPTLPAGLRTLAECFKSSGYATAAFNTNIQIGARFGYDRGYDLYADIDHPLGGVNTPKPPPSDVINRDILRWIDQTPAEKALITAWSMDVHMPFEPPPGFGDGLITDPAAKGTVRDILAATADVDFKNLAALYDAGIRYNDHTLGSLIDSLRRLGLWESTTFILCSDHGEMIAEHGRFMNHGIPPYIEVTHVPLIIKSRELRRGRRTCLGGLIDLMPTLLHLTNISDPPTSIQGHDLQSAARPRHVFSECSDPRGGHVVAVCDERWKALRSNMTLRTWVSRRFRTMVRREAPTNTSGGEEGRPRPLEADVPPRLARRFARQGMRIVRIGTPPCFCGNIVAWIAAMVRHFLGRTRLELYDRTTDAREQRNVVALHRDRVNEIEKAIDSFESENRQFKSTLTMTQAHETPDAAVTERLRSLGYLE